MLARAEADRSSSDATVSRLRAKRNSAVTRGAAFGVLLVSVALGMSGCGLGSSESKELSVTDSYGSSLARVVTDGLSDTGECAKHVGKPWVICDIEEDPGSGVSMTAVLWPGNGKCWMAQPLRFGPGPAKLSDRLYRGCVTSSDRRGINVLGQPVDSLSPADLSGIPNQPPDGVTSPAS